MIEEQHRKGNRTVGVQLFLPDGELSASIDCLCGWAKTAFAVGFDLVTFGEHHDGTPGYLSFPLGVIARVLSESDGEAGVYPYIAGLRRPAVALEELTVARATHPGRLRIAVGSGYADRDFAFFGTRREEAGARLKALVELMQSTWHDRDAAPLLFAGGGSMAVKLAATYGMGLFLPPVQEDEEATIADQYEDAGGTGPVVVQRWLKSPFEGGNLYSELRTPWKPRAISWEDAADLAQAFEATFASHALIHEISVRTGGPQADPASVSPLLEACGEALAILRREGE